MLTTPSSSPSDEKTLISLAANGDLDAFNELVLKYQNLAYTQARILLDDETLAEDATQESFIKAFRNIHQFIGGSFRAWLMKIVTNTSIDMLRCTKRHPHQPLFPPNEEDNDVEPFWLTDPSPSVETLVAQHELSMNIYKLLSELPEHYRTVITLVDIQALDYVEAAEVLGLPIGTIKSRLARARRQLRGKLLGHGMRVKTTPSSPGGKAYSTFVDHEFAVA